MNALMKSSVILAVPFLVLGAGCAGMGGGNKVESIAAARNIAATPPTVSFTQADLDGDARITRQEFDLWRSKFGESAASGQAAAGGDMGRQQTFDAADANANGVLTLDEWQTIVNPVSAAAGTSRGTNPRSASGAGVGSYPPQGNTPPPANSASSSPFARP